MIRKRASIRNLGRDKRAVSPAISTVILTSAIVSLLIVTIVFANNFLNARLTENEFNAMKQFMQTVGLQIDDVAWTIGRTQTIRYASKFGQTSFIELALNYTIYINGSIYLANYTTGILLFKMPISTYSLGNNYYESIFPSDRSFLQADTSAPVSHVYAIEKLPMSDGNFLRVVVTPTVRILNSTITTDGGVKNYFKFYLPILEAGTHLYRSQSVTLAGSSVLVKTGNGNSVKIVASFPKTGLGFDVDFFKFERTEEVVNVPSGSIIEFYTGEVVVSLGLHI